MLVSVVLPSYNHERYLRRAIESVLAQTHEDWELWVIDDGSKDRSLEVARSFSDSRIQVEANSTNLGTYGTENRGLDLARGDYVAILNSDDAWHADKLALQLEQFHQMPEAQFSYTGGQLIDDQDRPHDAAEHHRDYPRESLQTLLPYLMNVNQVLASSLVFRKGAVRFDSDFRYCGDWIAAIQLSRRGTALFVDAPLTYWRQHAANSSKDLQKTLGEEVRIRRALLREAPRWPLASDMHSLRDRKLALSALDLAAHLVLIGEMKEARRACAQAIAWGDRATLKTARRRFLATMLPQTVACKRLWPNLSPKEFVLKAPLPDFTFGEQVAG